MAAPQKAPGDLDERIGEHFFPGESAKDGESEGDGGIQMRAGGFSGDVDSHGDGESPGEGDVGVAAFIEQHVHRDDAVAEQDQDHRAEKFGEKLCGEPVVHRYRILKHHQRLMNADKRG